MGNYPTKKIKKIVWYWVAKQRNHVWDSDKHTMTPKEFYNYTDPVKGGGKDFLEREYYIYFQEVEHV